MPLINVPVTVIIDAICPTSTIGYYQLLAAFKQLSYSFEPSINIVVYGNNRNVRAGGEQICKHLFRTKGNCRKDCKTSLMELSSTSSELGLNYNLSEDMPVFSSHKANKLIHWLKGTPQQDEFYRKLTTAYFEKHWAIDDDDVLLSLLHEVGLDIDQAREILTSRDVDAELIEALDKWKDKGIYDTPCFIISDEFVLSGAQKKSCFFSVLKEVQKAHQQTA